MLGGHTALIGLIAALIGGLVTLIGLRWRRPQFNAEARKANAEASHTEWGTLRDEIDRLGTRITDLCAEVEEIKTASASREDLLDKDNKRLRDQVRRLSERVSELEAIFKIGPVPPEMQVALDKLNKAERGVKK